MRAGDSIGNGICWLGSSSDQGPKILLLKSSRTVIVNVPRSNAHVKAIENKESTAVVLNFKGR